MLLALVFLAAALLVLFDLIQPTYSDLQTKKGTELSTENLLASEKQIVSQAKNLIGQYENESQAQSNLSLAMPSGPSTAVALAEIYGIAQNTGMVIENIGIGAPALQAQSSAQGGGASAGVAQIKKPLGTFSLQITTAGSYENLKDFLSELEANIRIFDLTGLSMQVAPLIVTSGKGSSANTANTDYLAYSLTFATYYQLP